MKDSQQPLAMPSPISKYIKESNERFSTLHDAGQLET